MNIEAYERMLPPITDANRGYWEGAERGELCLQYNQDSGRYRFPEAPVDPENLSPEFEWKKVSGRGTLFSWIVMHQNYFPAFSDELPYLVAFILLDEGPYMYSTLVDPPEDLRCDDVVEVVFETVAGRAIPKFKVVRP
jgi:uncharacterized OB-fold protein